MLLGGVADMAAWSILLWHKTIDMLEHGTDVCVIPHSPLFISCNTSDSATASSRRQLDKKLKNPGTVTPAEILKLADFSNINMKQTKRGTYFSLSESLHEKMLKSKSLSRDCHGSQNCHLKVMSNENSADKRALLMSAEYSSTVPYARLGW